MANESRPDSITSSPRAKSYATSGALGGDVDLVAEFGGPVRMLRVGVAGDLKLVFPDDSEDIIYSVQIGEPVLVHASKIRASGTSAQKITAFP